MAPTVASVTPNLTTITDATVGTQTFTLTVVYAEAMNTSQNPTISFPTAGEDPTASPASLTFNSGTWTNATTYVATYDVADQNAAMPNIDVSVAGGTDAAGNAQANYAVANRFSIDTKNPTVASVIPSATTVSDANVGTQTFTLTVTYSEAMDGSVSPTIAFPTSGEDPTASPASLTLDGGSWTSSTTYVAKYDVIDQNVTMAAIDVQVSGARTPPETSRPRRRPPACSASTPSTRRRLGDAQPDDDRRRQHGEPDVHADRGLRQLDEHDDQSDDRLPHVGQGPDGVARLADVQLRQLDQRHDLRGQVQRGRPDVAMPAIDVSVTGARTRPATCKLALRRPASSASTRRTRRWPALRPTWRRS